MLSSEALKHVAKRANVKVLDEAIEVLRPEVDHRVRTVLQDAIKLMRNSKREVLTVEDLNVTLRLKGYDELLGLTSQEKSRQYKAADGQGLCFVADQIVSLEEIVSAPLAPCPLEPSVSAHWLAVEGVQPAILQNPSSVGQKRKAESKAEPPGVKVIPIVKHVLTLELQLYFDRITRTLEKDAQELLREAKEKLESFEWPKDENEWNVEAFRSELDQLVLRALNRNEGTHPMDQPQQQRSAGGRDKIILDSNLDMPSEVILIALEKFRAEFAQNKFRSCVLSSKPQQNIAYKRLCDEVSTQQRNKAQVFRWAKLTLEHLFSAHETLRNAQGVVLESLHKDSGLSELAPYFSQYIANNITQSLDHLRKLENLVRMAQAVLRNPNINMELYLHQVLPALVSCIVCSRIGSQGDDHWSLRELAAKVAVGVADKYGDEHPRMRTKLANTFVQILLDPESNMTTQYGALCALQLMGPHAVNRLVLPRIKPLYDVFLEAGKQAPADSVRALEASKCLDCIRAAARLVLADHLSSSADPETRAPLTIDVGIIKDIIGDSNSTIFPNGNVTMSIV